ncbi:MAG TPA: DUF2249 domain-containing protein [Vicinamibacteria bacterium]|nr:DUF2249 domain-containing protein [Vicinamibacteria bacterium]
MIETATPTLLDTRTLAKTDRCRSVLESFDRLEPGQTLVVLTDHDPRPLLRHFQKDRPGLFEWTPQESGPTLWRTEIFRRAANRGALRRVTEALAWDHDRLDALLSRTFDARAAGRLEDARRLWPEFERGLTRHIRFEEELLFPVFEEKAGLSSNQGPTAVMRAEHREIQMLLEGIGRVVGASGPAAEKLRAELLRVLGGHNDKEELVLYPGTDGLLSPEESDELVGRIQASS